MSTPLAVEIDKAVLDRACKDIIETILYCLPNAYKGTVYRIGMPPDLISTRITSGIIDPERSAISWGLPEMSDYNPPGKPWLAFRDEPGRPLEAMAWCVEKQKSWTAADPMRDVRSVRLQVAGVHEDYHHMEPVLIRKQDLYPDGNGITEYPTSFDGKTLWANSEYVVAAVIKIHFRPNTIRMNSPETRVIKRLSKALGTELLSYQLRELSLDAIKQLAEDRLHTCNTLADSLRNAIAKSGIIFSLIRLELAFLREQWEAVILGDTLPSSKKNRILANLDHAAKSLDLAFSEGAQALIGAQSRFLHLSLPPRQEEAWVQTHIAERWESLFSAGCCGVEEKGRIRGWIDELRESLHAGMDPEVMKSYGEMSEGEKADWIELIYGTRESIDLDLLGRMLHTLETHTLGLAFQNKSKKSLMRLKALAEIIVQLEKSTNEVLRLVLNGREALPPGCARK